MLIMYIIFQWFLYDYPFRKKMIGEYSILYRWHEKVMHDDRTHFSPHNNHFKSCFVFCRFFVRILASCKTNIVMNSVHSLDWNCLKTGSCLTFWHYRYQCVLAYSELNPNDRPVLSQKKRSGRRRRHQDRATYEHRREECVFLQHIIEQQVQFREQI